MRKKQGKPQKTKYVVSPDAKPSSLSSSDMVPMATLMKPKTENGLEHSEKEACKLLFMSLYSTPFFSSHPAFGKTSDMSVDVFCAHVKKLHEDSNRGFSEEYKVCFLVALPLQLPCRWVKGLCTDLSLSSIQQTFLKRSKPCEDAKLPCNVAKNRFASVLPCEC